MKIKEKMVLFLLLIVSLCCIFNPAFARRVADFGGTTDILHQVERKLAFTDEQLKNGGLTNQAAANDYLEVINLLQNLYHQGLNHSRFKSFLENMEDAVSEYYGCVYYGEGLIEPGDREQMILGSVSLDMSELLEKAPDYIRGKASGILEYAIPCLSDGSKAGTVRSKLLFLMDNGDYLARFYAVKSLGKLVQSLSNPARQDELISKMASLLEDKDMLVVGGAIQSLRGVLKSVNTGERFKNGIIDKLISQYVRLNSYPVKSYLTECLRDLAGNEPDKWRDKISEVLGRYHIIDRDNILSYIFNEEKH